MRISSDETRKFGFPQLVRNFASRTDFEAVDSEKRLSLCDEFAARRAAKGDAALLLNELLPFSLFCHSARAMLARFVSNAEQLERELLRFGIRCHELIHPVG